MITFNMLGRYGRMGNQMFQYATLFAIAKKNGYEFGIPFKLKSENPYMNLCLDECFPNLSAKDSSSIINFQRAQERQFTYNPGIFGIPDKTDILGYFQSEKYFKDYRDKIIQEFCFKQEIQNKAKDIRSVTKDKLISAHVRLGDYKNLKTKHPPCSIDYYKEAYTHLPDDLMTVVFSDEPQQAEEIFKSLGVKYFIPETNCQYTDMCLMTYCDYHIIANSSFSWWGSWLSSSKKTVAPSQWFGDDEGMPKNWSDIYCEEWTII